MRADTQNTDCLTREVASLPLPLQHYTGMHGIRLPLNALYRQNCQPSATLCENTTEDGGAHIRVRTQPDEYICIAATTD